jgi:hypothetical protein
LAEARLPRRNKDRAVHNVRFALNRKFMKCGGATSPPPYYEDELRISEIMAQAKERTRKPWR